MDVAWVLVHGDQAAAAARAVGAAALVVVVSAVIAEALETPDAQAAAQPLRRAGRPIRVCFLPGYQDERAERDTGQHVQCGCGYSHAAIADRVAEY
jgi:hypothetical protein